MSPFVKKVPCTAGHIQDGIPHCAGAGPIARAVAEEYTDAHRLRVHKDELDFTRNGREYCFTLDADTAEWNRDFEQGRPVSPRLLTLDYAAMTVRSSAEETGNA